MRPALQSPFCTADSGRRHYIITPLRLRVRRALAAKAQWRAARLSPRPANRRRIPIASINLSIEPDGPPRRRWPQSGLHFGSLTVPFVGSLIASRPSCINLMLLAKHGAISIITEDVSLSTTRPVIKTTKTHFTRHAN